MKEMVSLDELHELLLKLRDQVIASKDIEEVEIINSLDRILAEDIVATEDVPPFDIATMDGYAIKGNNCDSYKLIGEIYAGSVKNIELRNGEAVYVATGAKIPKNADAVLKIEIVDVKNGFIYPLERIPKGRYILKKGSDLRRGEIVLKKGKKLDPWDLPLIKQAGRDKIKVYKKLRVGVLSTGDEIKNGIIKDTNSIMIQAFLRKWGCETRFLGVLEDDYHKIKNKLKEAAEEYDVIVTVGGVSVGKRDYVLKVLNDIGTILIHKIRLRPGKPLTVATINEKPVFALPGKPSGAFAALLSIKTFFTGETSVPRIRAKLDRRIVLPDKDFKYLIFVKLNSGYAMPIGFAGSPLKLFDGEIYEVSLISSTTKTLSADGVIIANRNIEKEESVEVIPLRMLA